MYHCTRSKPIVLYFSFDAANEGGIQGDIRHQGNQKTTPFSSRRVAMYFTTTTTTTSSIIIIFFFFYFF